jgi:hypothetical protein
MDSGARVGVITIVVSSGAGFASAGALSGASASTRALLASRMTVSSEL